MIANEGFQHTVPAFILVNENSLLLLFLQLKFAFSQIRNLDSRLLSFISDLMFCSYALNLAGFHCI